MNAPRQLVLISCLAALTSGSLAGCAASAIGDPDLQTDTDDALANEDPAQDAGREEEEEDDDSPPATKRDASIKKDDAAVADSGAQDAGNAPKDAGSTDAGKPATDAAAPKDASTPPAVADAGNNTPKDAGTDAGKPAEPPPRNDNQCNKDSDCTNLCVAVGIIPCCTIVNTCGCTWAPGAYCL